MDAADGLRWASISAFTKIVTPAGAEVPVLYLSVKLDDPSLPAPIYATLSEVEG